MYDDATKEEIVAHYTPTVMRYFVWGGGCPTNRPSAEDFFLYTLNGCARGMAADMLDAGLITEKGLDGATMAITDLLAEYAKADVATWRKWNEMV